MSATTPETQQQALAAQQRALEALLAGQREVVHAQVARLDALHRQLEEANMRLEQVNTTLTSILQRFPAPPESANASGGMSLCRCGKGGKCSLHITLAG